MVAGAARRARRCRRACDLSARKGLWRFRRACRPRIFESMGVREALQAIALPITSTRIYFGPRLGFRGAIPYYQADHGLPRHGFIVPRHILDQRLLEQARRPVGKCTRAAQRAGSGVKMVGFMSVRGRRDRVLTHISTDRRCRWRGIPRCEGVQPRNDRPLSYLDCAARLRRRSFG